MIRNFRIFKIDKMKTPNNGDRTLYESVAYTEVEKALKDWINIDTGNCVLIGGIAFSYYTIPRSTQDIDVLYLMKEDIPISLSGFKRTRNGAFQHNKTHVEVEVVTPTSINLREELAKVIFETAVKKHGIKIASPSGLIVSKLTRFNRRDQADIEDLIKTQKIDLSVFNLTNEELNKFNSIKDNLYD